MITRKQAPARRRRSRPSTDLAIARTFEIAAADMLALFAQQRAQRWPVGEPAKTEIAGGSSLAGTVRASARRAT